jgi:hypothetical protein
MNPRSARPRCWREGSDSGRSVPGKFKGMWVRCLLLEGGGMVTPRQSHAVEMIQIIDASRDSAAAVQNGQVPRTCGMQHPEPWLIPPADGIRESKEAVRQATR